MSLASEVPNHNVPKLSWYKLTKSRLDQNGQKSLQCSQVMFLKGGVLYSDIVMEIR